MYLVEVSFAKFAECFSFKLHWFIYKVVRFFFNGFAFHCFPADAAGKHLPLYAHGVGAF